MDGQTDRHCPCCGEEEEGELKCHGHPDWRVEPSPAMPQGTSSRIGPVDSAAHLGNIYPWLLGSLCGIYTP